MDNREVDRLKAITGDNFDNDNSFVEGQKIESTTLEKIIPSNNAQKDTSEPIVTTDKKNILGTQAQEVNIEQIMPPGVQTFSTDQTISKQNPEITISATEDEKDWNDKVEKTINQYANNPYELAEKYRNLSDAYLKEEFGRSLGDRNI